MAAVVRAQGRHGGSRRGEKAKPSFQPRLLGLAVGVTLAVVAWGYLVYAAIDFGSRARGGDDTAWWFLGLGAAGAVACLFLGLMLIVRLLRALGITSGPRPQQPEAVPDPVPLVQHHDHRATHESSTPKQPPAAGGKRAAR
jgi:hypothetical protein